jgi:RNA polymerase subunit RPABC4/transcription elongation factor Spt4
MNQTQRRCLSCGLQIEADAEYCPDCGSEDLLLVSGHALAVLIARQHYVHARRYSFIATSMVHCAFCHSPIEVAEAYHSRIDGKPLYGQCKSRETVAG